MVLEAIRGHRAGFGRVWKVPNADSSVGELRGYVDGLKAECEGFQAWLDG